MLRGDAVSRGSLHSTVAQAPPLAAGLLVGLSAVVYY